MQSIQKNVWHVESIPSKSKSNVHFYSSSPQTACCLTFGISFNLFKTQL